MNRAFTLIETMICIALLAIYLSTNLEIWQSVRRLRQQDNFRWAALAGQKELARLQTLPYASLPPQVVRTDGQGRLGLGQVDANLDTVQVRALRGSFEPLEILGRSQGGIQLNKQYANQSVLVDYQFTGQELKETHRLVDSSQPVGLRGQPVQRVAAVWQAQGDQLRPLQGFTVRGGQLYVPSARPGSVVCVDYVASGNPVRVRGQFLDQEMRPILTPSPFKLMTVSAGYGSGQTVTLQSLRVNQP